MQLVRRTERSTQKNGQRRSSRSSRKKKSEQLDISWKKTGGQRKREKSTRLSRKRLHRVQLPWSPIPLICVVSLQQEEVVMEIKESEVRREVSVPVMLTEHPVFEELCSSFDSHVAASEEIQRPVVPPINSPTEDYSMGHQRQVSQSSSEKGQEGTSGRRIQVQKSTGKRLYKGRFRIKKSSKKQPEAARTSTILPPTTSRPSFPPPLVWVAASGKSRRRSVGVVQVPREGAPLVIPTHRENRVVGCRHCRSSDYYTAPASRRAQVEIQYCDRDPRVSSTSSSQHSTDIEEEDRSRRRESIPKREARQAKGERHHGEKPRREERRPSSRERESCLRQQERQRSEETRRVSSTKDRQRREESQARSKGRKRGHREESRQSSPKEYRYRKKRREEPGSRSSKEDRGNSRRQEESSKRKLQGSSRKREYRRSSPRREERRTSLNERRSHQHRSPRRSRSPSRGQRRNIQDELRVFFTELFAAPKSRH